MRNSLKSLVCVTTVALMGIAVDAADDGGRCSKCGKLTMVGGNHLCKSRKKSRSISFSVANKQPESPSASVETKKVVVPQELRPLDGTYATEVISTSSRVWTDETGRKIEATWAHVSKDYEHVFLKSVKTKRRLDVSVSQLALRFVNQSGIIALPKANSDEKQKMNKDIFGFEISLEDYYLLACMIPAFYSKEHPDFNIPAVKSDTSI